MEIIYSREAVKSINKLDKQTKQRIKTGIEALTLKPPKGDIKQMQGFEDNRFRLRIGKYRIVYKFLLDNSIEILYIINIGSRGDIYK